MSFDNQLTHNRNTPDIERQGLSFLITYHCIKRVPIGNLVYGTHIKEEKQVETI